MFFKNRKIAYFIGASVLTSFAVVACLFIENYSRTALDSEIKFNYESGFYDEPIEVELSVGSNYYLTYTLDGKAPNAASTRYEKPICITDASENENVFSASDETSLLYYNYSGYGVPDYKVDKCSVLRVSAFDYSGNQISSDVREYFIGFADKTGYKNMYNLCVSTDPENLFSEDRGIYHVGSYLKGKIESCKIYDMYDSEAGWDGEDLRANWCASGKEAERPATIEFFDPEGKLLTREKCGVRVRGGISRGDVQKPLGFYSRKAYSGDDYFSFDFFDEGNGPHTFLIHSLGNDCDVKMIDYIVFSALSKGDNTYTISPLIPCNLFLDGEYWGPMFVMKDINCEQIEQDFDVNGKNVVLIKSGNVKIGDEFELLAETEYTRWLELQDFIKNSDMSLPKNYEYVSSQMDMKDFAEYAATEIYIGNADWHSDNNYACWRTTKKENNNPYTDGRWRFYLFDVNWSFETSDVIWGETYEDWDFYHMVKCLCKNEEFREMYLKKISELEIMFEPDTVGAIIDEWSTFMEEPIRCNFKRFAIESDADERIAQRKEQIISFCEKRPSEMKELNRWFFDN